MTNEEAVVAGVDAYAEAETALRAAHDALLKLPDTYAAVSQNGVDPLPPDVRQFGYLEAQRRSGRAKRLAGRVGELLELVFDAHGDDTDRAKELGIDLPPQAPPGTVTPMGGGR